MTLNLWHIVGARPQFMKLGAVYRAAAKYSDIQQTIVHTGQHYDPNLSDVFFSELGLPKPNFNLGIGGSSQAEQIGNSVISISNLLHCQFPSVVIIYGDANSALSGAIACSYLKLQIAHVEAGFRLRFKHAEEINRVVADHLADLRFACTADDIENLKLEGLEQNSYLAGDTMFDNWLFQMPRQDNSIIDRLNIKNNDFVLVTCHRAEIVDDPLLLAEVLTALRTIAESGTEIVFPLHPRTRKRIEEYGLSKLLAGSLKVIEPIGFNQLQALVTNCRYVITDSGGLCREAYFSKKPAISPWKERVWPQLDILGWVIRTNTSATEIVDAAMHITAPNDNSLNAFGSGDAGEKIVDILRNQNRLLW